MKRLKILDSKQTKASTLLRWAPKTKWTLTSLRQPCQLMFRVSKATHLRTENKLRRSRRSKPNLKNKDQLKASLRLRKFVSIPLSANPFQKVQLSKSRSSNRPMILLIQDRLSILISLILEQARALNTVQPQMSSRHHKEEFLLCQLTKAERHRVFSGQLQWLHRKTSRCRLRHA